MTLQRAIRKLSRGQTRALLHVLQCISEREGAEMPSAAVQHKAVDLLAAPKTEHRLSQPRLALSIPVRGETGEYDVTMYVLRPPRSEADPATHTDLGPWRIINARCSCPATTICAHLIAALAVADEAGYALAT